MTSSPLENAVAEPDAYAHETSKKPVSSIREEMVNKAKSVESALLLIRK
jgi:hypothetical protein